MDKKKIKLKLSGNLKKSISNIERAKTQGKNSVLIEKKNSKFSNKRSFNFNRQDVNSKKTNPIKFTTTNITADKASIFIDQFTFKIPELIQVAITTLFV